MRRIPILLAAALMMTSCISTYYIGKAPQSHFTYPNSNVTPLIKVSGRSTTTFKLFVPPSVTSKICEQAYSDAISKAAGADLLINVDAYHKVTMLPIPFVNLYFSKYIVEGTAAKQEVGKQKLSAN